MLITHKNNIVTLNKPLILNERAAILLKQLVASYIDDGQPVGSRQLAEDAGLDLLEVFYELAFSGSPSSLVGVL